MNVFNFPHFKIIISYLLLVFLLNCNEKIAYKNIPFQDLENIQDVANGKHPGYLYFLNEKYDTLQNLNSYSYVWIIIKDKEIEGIESSEIFIPGKNTKDKIRKIERRELEKVKYYQIKSTESDPTPFTLDEFTGDNLN